MDGMGHAPSLRGFRTVPGSGGGDPTGNHSFWIPGNPHSDSLSKTRRQRRHVPIYSNTRLAGTRMLPLLLLSPTHHATASGKLSQLQRTTCHRSRSKLGTSQVFMIAMPRCVLRCLSSILNSCNSGLHRSTCCPIFRAVHMYRPGTHSTIHL